MNLLEPILSKPLVNPLGWMLVHSVWQGAVLAALLAGVLFALRRASPGARYLVSCVTLTLMVIAPAVTIAWFPSDRPHAAPRPADDDPLRKRRDAPLVSRSEPFVPHSVPLPADFARPADVPVPGSEVVAPSERQSPRATVASPPLSERIDRALPWLVLAWLVGVVALSARLLVGWLAVQRIKRRATRPVSEAWVGALTRLARQLRVSRPVRLLESALVEVPTVIGWLRPVILFPASALVGLTPQQLEALLAHELAHVRRHDYLVNLLQSVVETLLFYHPAVWWVSRRIRANREECCDDLAISVCGDRVSYARALATMEELREGLGQLAVAARGGSLLQRISRVLGHGPPNEGSSGWWPVALVSLAALSIPVVALKLRALAEEGRPNAPAGAAASPAQPDWLGDEEQLPPEVVAVLGDGRLKHWQPVYAVAFSPDGRTIASGAIDGTITLWDVVTGKRTRGLNGHADRVTSLAFSRDGQNLASASFDLTVKLWDVATGRERTTFTGHTSWIWSVAFHPDGQTVVSGSRDDTIRFWDVASGREIRSVNSGQDTIFSVAYSPDGRLVASGSPDKSVKLWDARTGAELRTIAGHGERVHVVAFSPDGRALASGGEKTVCLWDVSTGIQRRRIDAHGDGWVACLAFSPDGQTLATGGPDRTARLWDLNTGEWRRILAHTASVDSVAFSPDGRTLIAGSGKVHVWDLDTGLERLVAPGHAVAVTSLAISPDGRTLASGSDDHTIRLWDLDTYQERSELQGHTDGVTCVAFSPDGRTLASGGWMSDESIRFWDPETGKQRFVQQAYQWGVMGMAFSPDGRTLASVGQESPDVHRPVRLWDAATGMDRGSLGEPDGFVPDIGPVRPQSVAFSPDGKTLALDVYGLKVLLWDAATGKERRVLHGPESNVIRWTRHALAFSPDGKSVAAGCQDNSVRLWDARTGREGLTLVGHSSVVWSVAFSRDGSRIATSAGDGTVRLWDARTGAALRTFALAPARGMIYQVAFTPDGRHVASANGNGTVYILRVPEGNDGTATPATASLPAVASTSGAGHTSGQAVQTTRVQGDQDWGQPLGGVRCRLRAVSASADENAPESAKAAERFDRPEDITFAVELQNVSDQPIKLLGVRYGDNVAAPWPGKSNSDSFAPMLFDVEFFHPDGRPLDRPTRELLDSDRMLATDSMVETIEPGKSLTVLLRPAKWKHGLEHRLEPGEYRVRVRYHGASEAVKALVRKHWPDKPAGTSWTGDVASNEVAFTIADDPTAKRPALVWGEPKDGLRAALEFVPTTPRPAQRGEGPGVRGDDALPHGTKFDVRIHLKNVSDRAISVWSESWRQGDRLTVTNEAGEVSEIGGAWYSGWSIMVRWTLKPGQVATLTSANLGIAADDESAKKFPHPIGKVFVAKPGKYLCRYELRFDSVQRKDKDGNVVVPGPNDFAGTITTGQTPLVVRAATPEDRARLDPTFTGLIEFVAADGKPIERGEAEVWAPTRNSRTKLSIKPGAIEVEVPTLTRSVSEDPRSRIGLVSQPVIVSVLAPGFEEQRFYDVSLKPDTPTRLALKPAEPVRFRLVSSAGSKLVDGVKVRLFNRSKLLASAGPYPMDGTNGPVWGTSNADGRVMLDTLQKIDPDDAKLGPNVYWFYIDPPTDQRIAGQTVAPRFIGPFQAGQDLGDIELGPLLEARGEIRGTPQVLDNFAAEWDQPEFMKGGPNDTGWDYAVSQPLETKRERDKLTFHLTGLRPGMLRIISNFAPGTKSVSHTYGRRDPGKDDVVFATELKESVRDIVITPSGGSMGVVRPESAKGVAAPPTNRQKPAEDPARATRPLGSDERLDKKIDYKASDMPLIFVLSDLGKHGVPISISLGELLDRGVDPQMRITVDLSDVTLRTALRTILARAGLDFAVTERGILIPAEKREPAAELIKALQSRDSEVRLKAAQGLKKIGKPAIPLLIKAMKGEAATLDSAMYVAFAEIGPDAVPALIEALSSENPRVRSRSAIALGANGPSAKQAIPALSKAADDPDWSVGARAVGALMRIDGEIVMRFVTHEKPRIRLHSREALVGPLLPMPRPLEESVVRALVAGLEDPDSVVRVYSAEALAIAHASLIGFSDRIDLGQVAKALAGMLRDNDKVQHAPAVRCLCRLGPRAGPAVPAMVEALSDEEKDVFVRVELAAAFQRYGWDATGAAPALVAVLEKGDLSTPNHTSLCIAAVALLRKMGRPRDELAMPLLIEAVKRWRADAAMELAEIGEPAKSAVPLIVEAWRADQAENSWPFSGGYLDALGRFGRHAEAALPALRAELRPDSDSYYRVTVARAIWRITGEPDEVLPLLINVLQSRKREYFSVPDTIALAVQVVGEIGPPAQSAIPTIQQLLRDPELRDIRGHAIEALRKIDPGSLPRGARPTAPADPATQRRLAQLRLGQANAERLRGDRAAAETAAREAIAILEKLVQESPEDRELQSELGDAYLVLAKVHFDANRAAEALPIVLKTRAIVEKLVNEFPNVRSYYQSLADVYSTLSEAQTRTGRHAEAEQSRHRAEAILQKLAAWPSEGHRVDAARSASAQANPNASSSRTEGSQIRAQPPDTEASPTTGAEKRDSPAATPPASTPRVTAADPDAAKRPRVVTNPGWYTLGDHIGFSVTRRPVGERIVNEASIVFSSPDGKAEPPGKPVKITLPDGSNTWAAAWLRGTAVLWVAQKDLVQKYDFTNPAKVEETRFEADRVATAPVPREIREALRAALAVPGPATQQQAPLNPPAAEKPE